MSDDWAALVDKTLRVLGQSCGLRSNLPELARAMRERAERAEAELAEAKAAGIHMEIANRKSQDEIADARRSSYGSVRVIEDLREKLVAADGDNKRLREQLAELQAVKEWMDAFTDEDAARAIQKMATETLELRQSVENLTAERDQFAALRDASEGRLAEAKQAIEGARTMLENIKRNTGPSRNGIPLPREIHWAAAKGLSFLPEPEEQESKQ